MRVQQILDRDPEVKTIFVKIMVSCELHMKYSQTLYVFYNELMSNQYLL
jgi:hypothetical protein